MRSEARHDEAVYPRTKVDDRGLAKVLCRDEAADWYGYGEDEETY